MNKRKLVLAGLLLMLVTSVNAQSLWDRFTGWFTGTTTIEASNNIVTKTVPLSEFNALSKTGSIDAIYIQEEGNTNPRVVISGPDNIVELVVVEQSGKTVKLHYKSNTSFRLNKKPFKVEVYAAEISKFALSGSGDLEFGEIKSGDLTISLSGSGDVSGRSVRSTGDVTLSVTGSGDIGINQVGCFVLHTNVTGSGDLEVKGINSESVAASVTGSGDIQLAGTTEKASYNVVGAGDIDARGLKAKEVKKSKTGSGSIEY